MSETEIPDRRCWRHTWETWRTISDDPNVTIKRCLTCGEHVPWGDWRKLGPGWVDYPHIAIARLLHWLVRPAVRTPNVAPSAAVVEILRRKPVPGRGPRFGESVIDFDRVVLPVFVLAMPPGLGADGFTDGPGVPAMRAAFDPVERVVYVTAVAFRRTIDARRERWWYSARDGLDAAELEILDPLIVSLERMASTR